MNFTEKINEGYDNLTEAEKRVVSYLPSGKENAKTARALEPFTGLSQKELSRVARHALDVGYPVIACQHGFYVAVSDAEVAEYMGREQVRDLQHGKTLASCERFLRG